MGDQFPRSIRIEFATPEDERAVELDRVLYGTASIERNEDGKWRRVDPLAVRPADEDHDG